MRSEGAQGEKAGEAPPRLAADAMLGSLARWLRVLGLDTLYDPGLDDAELVARAEEEGRVILTRDRRLTQRRRARRHLLIRSQELPRQLAQVLGELALHPDPARLLTRCLRCNVPIEDLPREEARGRVPPYVYATQKRFRRCPACGRIYWRASHARRMLGRLRQMGVLAAGGK